MQKDENTLRRSVRKRKLTGPIKVATELTMPTEPVPADLVEEKLELLEVPTLPITEKFNKLSEKEKMGTIYSVMSQVCDKLSEVNVTIHDDIYGMCTRIATCQTQADNNTLEQRSLKTDVGTKAKSTDLVKAEEDIGKLQHENAILKGLLQKQHGQIKVLNDKVAYLSKKVWRTMW